MTASPDPAIALVAADPVDELILRRNPVVLGHGIPLFEGARGPTTLELQGHQVFAGGVAIHRYRLAR